MEITKLEKAALITTGAAAAYKTLLWSLEASVDSSDAYIIILRFLFAALSFVAFDLVITSVVFRGWSWSGAGALLVAGVVSAAIGLDVARVWTMPALHAAPAIVLIAFGAHLMWCRRGEVDVPEPAGTINNTQINVGVPLPPTVAAYIAAKAAEQPQLLPDELATLIGVGVRSVRTVLQLPEQEATQ